MNMALGLQGRCVWGLWGKGTWEAYRQAIYAALGAGHAPMRGREEGRGVVLDVGLGYAGSARSLKRILFHMCISSRCGVMNLSR